MRGLSDQCVEGLSYWSIGVWGGCTIGTVCEGCLRLVQLAVVGRAWYVHRTVPGTSVVHVERTPSVYCIQGVTSLSFRTPATAPCILLLVVVLVVWRRERGDRFLYEKVSGSNSS